MHNPVFQYTWQQVLDTTCWWAAHLIEFEKFCKNKIFRILIFYVNNWVIPPDTCALLSWPCRQIWLAKIHCTWMSCLPYIHRACSSWSVFTWRPLISGHIPAFMHSCQCHHNDCLGKPPILPLIALVLKYLDTEPFPLYFRSILYQVVNCTMEVPPWLHPV